jgi:glycerol-1-phosphate dehydrogenase [NAD(P)+]
MNNRKSKTERNQQINLPNFFELGKNILDIYKILIQKKIFCKKILILGDDKTFRIGGNRITKILQQNGINVIKEVIRKSDENTVRKIVKIIQIKKPDVLIGFGGGKTLDVAKLAAGMNDIKFISIPTILSNDGIASPVAVITDKNGIPISHITKPPYGIIVDYNVIKRAPIRHLRAGVGDLISNLSAVFDCRLAIKKGKENIQPELLKLAEAGPKNLLRLRTRNVKSEKFLKCLCDGLIKSGLAMCLAGSSRPASGGEHKISHSLDYLFPLRNALHGEQVGIATILTMALQKNPYLNAVKRFYKEIKFPFKLSCLNINDDKFIEAVKFAKNIRPWRYTILEEKEFDENKLRNLIKKFYKEDDKK